MGAVAGPGGQPPAGAIGAAVLLNSGPAVASVETGAQAPAFVMDGVRDAAAQEVAANGARHLYAALSGDVLYVATEDAGEG